MFQVPVRFHSIHHTVLITMSTFAHDEQEREGSVKDLSVNRQSWLAKTATDATRSIDRCYTQYRLGSSIDWAEPKAMPAFIRLCLGGQPEAGMSFRQRGLLFQLSQYNRKSEIQRQRL